MEPSFTSHLLHGVSFGGYTGREIRKLSVKEITNPMTFDLLGHPVQGGLHDSALGPFERDDVCSTCGQTAMHCPGHIGHISLPVPVYNPLFFTPLIKLMRGTCFKCHRLMLLPRVSSLLLYQLRLLELGLVGAAEELQDVFYGQLLADSSKELEMIEYYEKQVRELGLNKTQHCHSYRNITVQKENLVKDFLNGKFLTKTTCPHCKASTRGQKLRTEYHAQVFLQVGKRERKSAMRKLPPKAKKRPEDANGEADIEPDVEMHDGKAEDDGNMEEGEEEEEGVVQQTQLEENLSSSSGQTYITASKARHHMRAVWENDKELMRSFLGVLHRSAISQTEGEKDHHPVDLFFMDVIPVPPNRFRPVPMMGDKRFANPQTNQLQKVMEDCESIRTALLALKDKDIEATLEDNPETKRLLSSLPGKTLALKLQLAWLQLQSHVNILVDSDLDKLTAYKDKTPGIKQVLEKKAGLLRMHMMGKRVDFAARSVISPDPYINTNEIGIPEVFAKKLTYPQPVTPWNFQELKQAVINGPKNHPGAILVEYENGSRMLLNPNSKTQREAVAKQLLTPRPGQPVWGTKKVYRHLRNGDVLLLNRQPTLHRPSIQAHRARILPGERTLRMHYANCKAYNADFDGDEMNAHFPQNELARAEAYNISSTDYQYLVPKDGTPLPGLIQDHMVSGVSLTTRGCYFCRGDYHQLVFGALSDRNGPVKTLPPSIVKPYRLWSGKQVISTVLLNVIPEDQPPLNIKGKAKVSEKTWGPGLPSGRWPVKPEALDLMGESTVVIRGGELLVGILDKAHYGPTPYGLVHSCYELYGGPVAGRLLTALGRLFTCFLQLRGFTLGVEDILVTKKADKKRRKLMKRGRGCGPEVAAGVLGVDDPTDTKTLQKMMQAAHFSPDGGLMKDLDLSMKGKTDEVQNSITKVCMPEGLYKKFPENNLQLMVQSGAKGSTVNCMQISGLLGQIELEGRRPPLSMSGASLPSFLPYDMSPRAGGFVDGRFLTGIRPQEYFFHCMAGREGLVDTAVKTSRSGYLQRCIIKHLEGLTVNYDLTVRDSDGSVIQFQYGEDGMDISKSKYFDPKQLSFLIENKEVAVRGTSLRETEKRLHSDKVHKYWKQVKKWKKKAKKRSRSRHSGFVSFSAICSTELPPGVDHVAAKKQIVDRWCALEEEDRISYEKKWPRCPDPVASRLLPCSHLGAITERLDGLINNYIQSNPSGLLVSSISEARAEQMPEESFQQMMHVRAQRALAEPGEAIGLLAAQSIGEPSTQMTLNTFHFAGRGEMNVTLGIPRLREILMVASATIKTPTMDIPVLDTPEARAKVQNLRMKLNKVCLSQVLEDVHVYESVSVANAREKCYVYRMRFNFLPPEMYQSEYNVRPSSILRYMELRFIRNLLLTIDAKMVELGKAQLLSSGKVQTCVGFGGRRTQTAQDDEDISDDDLNDGDAAATKARERQQEDLDYMGEEEEREEVDEEPTESEVESSADEEETKKEDDDKEESSFDEDVAGTRVSKKKKKKKKKKKRNLEMDQTRVNNVLRLPKVIKYEYDADEELWCEVTIKLPLTTSKLDMTSLIEGQAKQGRVYHTEKISRCLVVEGRKAGEEGTRIRTEQEPNPSTSTANVDVMIVEQSSTQTGADTGDDIRIQTEAMEVDSKGTVKVTTEPIDVESNENVSITAEPIDVDAYSESVGTGSADKPINIDAVDKIKSQLFKKCVQSDTADYSKEGPFTDLFVQGSGTVQHKLNLQPVYSGFEDDPSSDYYGQPVVSTHHSKANVKVDFIFYSSQEHENKTERGKKKREHDLLLCSTLKLLTGVEMCNYGGLPNDIIGSDHHMLMAKFALKLKPS